MNRQHQIVKVVFSPCLRADFVGIVECNRAGGIVAGYSVLESWKGPRPGTHITIRVAVNYWEPQFPITLCGERYFVTAFKRAPLRVTSTTSGKPVPLWWRNIPADYNLPLFQGRKRLAPGRRTALISRRLGRRPRSCWPSNPRNRMRPC